MSALQPPLVFEEVRDKLRDRLSQTCKPGDRLPPIPELARQLGGGQVNTGRAVRALVREGLLVSRPKRGTFVRQVAGGTLTHVRSAAPADPLHVLAGKRVLLLRPNSSDAFMQAALAAADDELRRAQAMPQERQYRMSTVAPVLSEHPDCQAVVVFNPQSIDRIQPLPGQAMVMVRTGVDQMVAAGGRADMVTVDSEQGGFLAGEWLRRCGVRSACFVGRHLAEDTGHYDATSLLRLDGFEQGLGASLDPSRRLKVPFYKVDCGGLAMAMYLKLDPRPIGVFCASDDLAFGFACAGLSHGMIPGRDFQLVGFDGQLRGRELTHGPLTTVEAPVDAMGRAAVKLLAQRLAWPDEPARRVALSCGFFSGKTALPSSFDPSAATDISQVVLPGQE
jgi:DNA-binding LacI/PurR family transcriptional regulator